MAYVDLNPIRAGIAVTPEQSDFTSIQRRIKAAITSEQPSCLLPFTGNEPHQKSTGVDIYFSLADYLTLFDEPRRFLRDDKCCAIDTTTVNILARLHINDESWLKLNTDFETIFTGAVGTADHLCEFSEHVGLQRTHGLTNAQACLNSTQRFL
jgi:hypothetical protein